jgi:hypothetical protein
MFHELLQTAGRLKRPHETVWGVSDDFKRVESHACPMSTCAAPAGSPCRTGKRKVAIQYHTARFRLVPSLAKALNVPTPAVRKPGTAWTELRRPANAGAKPTGHVRLGYARASTARARRTCPAQAYGPRCRPARTQLHPSLPCRAGGGGGVRWSGGRRWPPATTGPDPLRALPSRKPTTCPRPQ